MGSNHLIMVFMDGGIIIFTFCGKCYVSMQNRRTHSEDIINKKLRDNTARTLNEHLPKDITGIILSMVHIDLSNIAMQNHQKIWRNITTYFLLLIYYVYPLTRVIANFICVAVVIARYTKWYGENSEISCWSKCCAFIWIWFYLPNFKIRGLIRGLLLGIYNDFGQTPMIKNTFLVEIVIDIAFIVWIIVISFPVLLFGMIIFIPTAIIMVTCEMAILFIVFSLTRSSLDNVGKGPIQHGICGGVSSLIMGFGFGGYWFMMAIILSAMEFFDDTKWAKAIRIGFVGDYCDQNDYFSFSKWDQYDWDVRFLIVSWLLF